MRTAPPGQHNAVLCRAVYALGQLVGAGLLDHVTARAELTTAASRLLDADCGCTPTEVARGIAAGLAAGARNPRRLPLPDGRTLLASAGGDRTVRLWDPTTGQQIGRPLIGHTEWVNAVCPLPLADGCTLLATGSNNRTVLAWKPDGPIEPNSAACGCSYNV